MMSSDIERVLHCIAKETLIVVRQIFDEKGLINSDILRNIDIDVSLADNLVVKIIYDDYLAYIEQGRKANSSLVPPISALREWAERKGLPTNNEVLFAIANTIRKNGIAPRPILEIVKERLHQQFDDSWSEQLIEIMVSELTSCFSD